MPREMLEWHAPQYRFRERSADWYLATSIIAVAIIATSLILSNVLFAIFIGVAFVSLLLYAKREPLIVHYRLSASGVYEGNTFRPFSAFESFWVEHEFGDPKLLLKSRHMVSPLTAILLEGVDFEAVRAFLAERLPEEELHEPLSKKIMEFLGF